MKSKLKERTPENVNAEECHHFWVIEVADGPKSSGECKYCGAKKEFLNAFPDYNPLRKSRSPLDLPEMKKVTVDKGNES